jgi:neutral ceramidase
MATKKAAVETTWMVGAAKRVITAFEPGMEMFGWAQPYNQSHGADHDLHARGVFVGESTSRGGLFYGCLELAFVPQGVRDAIVERLSRELPDAEVSESSVMLTATHTHSGPGGYSTDLFYTFSSQGFSPRVFDSIVDGTVAALADAWRGRTRAQVRFERTTLPMTEPVSFNRAIKPYNANKGVRAVTWERRHEATNRDMTVMRADAHDGTPIASINWFAVHCTSMHSEHTRLHADNKGYAAQQVEELEQHRAGNTGYVAIFSQAASGDVSPNFRWCSDRQRMIGVYDDDDASARFNGDIQAGYGLRLLERARAATPVPVALRTAMHFHDFDGTEVDAEFAGGKTGRRTGSAVVGLSFMEGTLEGPGPLLKIPHLRRALSLGVAARKRFAAKNPDDPHGPKYPFLETGRGGNGRAFGMFNMADPGVPDWLDPLIAESRRLTRSGGQTWGPWTQNVLPIQLVTIGGVAIAALPVEPTTEAGRRIEQSLRDELAPAGVHTVIIQGYSNSYAGYLTTNEEYQLQDYEGGSTYHGQWTLAGYQTGLRRLARGFVARQTRLEPTNHGPQPYRPAVRELDARHFEAVPRRKTWLR